MWVDKSFGCGEKIASCGVAPLVLFHKVRIIRSPVSLVILGGVINQSHSTGRMNARSDKHALVRWHNERRHGLSAHTDVPPSMPG
jgi:hypothetical protein